MDKTNKINSIADELEEYVATNITTYPQRDYVRTWGTNWATQQAELIMLEAERAAEKYLEQYLEEALKDAKSELDNDLNFGLFYKKD